MTKQITITATHPRSGWTRLAARFVPFAKAHRAAEAMSEFDALQCIEAGQGEWATEAVPAEDKPPRRA